MWELLTKTGNDVSFIEGEYGIALPITLRGVEVGSSDYVKISIKTGKNGDTILEKEYTDITNNVVGFILTKEESARLPVGSYVYNLDWYQDNVFQGTVINGARLKVVDKA